MSSPWILSHHTANLAIALVILLLGALPGHAADGPSPEARHEQHRTRTVESSLKDLSNRNEARLPSIDETPRPNPRSFEGEPVDLTPHDAESAADLIRRDTAFGLNRLRRETASRQTADDRAARVDESLDREMTEALDRSATPSPGIPVREAEFAPLRDERFNLRPEDDPANAEVTNTGVESNLHRLRRPSSADREPDPPTEQDPE
jgi:hypothetical protein